MTGCEGLLRPFNSSTEAEQYILDFVEEMGDPKDVAQGKKKFAIGLPVIWWASAGATTLNLALESLSEESKISLKSELELVIDYVNCAQDEYVRLCGDNLQPCMALVLEPRMPMDHAWWRMELYLQLNNIPRAVLS